MKEETKTHKNYIQKSKRINLSSYMPIITIGNQQPIEPSRAMRYWRMYKNIFRIMIINNFSSKFYLFNFISEGMEVMFKKIFIASI